MKSNRLEQNISDEVLIERYSAGDLNAIDLLYSRYYNIVIQQCYNFIKDLDLAMDMTQEIFMKVFTHQNTFKGNSQFKTWLYRVTLNHCLSISKGRKIKYFEFSSNYECETNYIDQDLTEYELDLQAKYDRMKESINKLSIEDRKILYLKYEKNVSIEEITRELNISRSAAKMRLMRARKAIQSDCDL